MASPPPSSTFERNFLLSFYAGSLFLVSFRHSCLSKIQQGWFSRTYIQGQRDRGSVDDERGKVTMKTSRELERVLPHEHRHHPCPVITFFSLSISLSFSWSNPSALRDFCWKIFYIEKSRGYMDDEVGKGMKKSRSITAHLPSSHRHFKTVRHVHFYSGPDRIIKTSIDCMTPFFPLFQPFFTPSWIIHSIEQTEPSVCFWFNEFSFLIFWTLSNHSSFLLTFSSDDLFLLRNAELVKNSEARKRKLEWKRGRERVQNSFEERDANGAEEKVHWKR